MAAPFPGRYTRAWFNPGAKGFVFIPRVGAIVNGTIDAYGWKAPYFDEDGNEIREDGVNLGTVVTEGDKRVPALTDGDGTTRELSLFDPEGLAEWQLKRTPPGDFANLDWRGQGGDPEAKQIVLNWWGPPNRYWNAEGGDYPPYTDRIYRRGKLWLRAPEILCGCAARREGNALIAVVMQPVGGAYADGNITHDKLYARVVRGLHTTQDKEETGIFDQDEFDQLVAEYNSAVLGNRLVKKQEIIEYSQRWHEIDLKDHENLVDTTTPESEVAADNERTVDELFPWHFNGSGNECQTLRRMTAHVEHQVAGAAEEWDVASYRYDRLKLSINYNATSREVGGGFHISVIAPTITVERITNERVPIWRVDEDWEETESYPGSHPSADPVPHTTYGTTGSASSGFIMKVVEETFHEDSEPGLQSWGSQFDVSQAAFEGFYRFSPPQPYTPDEDPNNGNEWADYDLRDHYLEGHESEGSFTYQLSNDLYEGGSVIDSSREANIEVAVDYRGDQEVVAVIAYHEQLIANDYSRHHDFRHLWAQTGFGLSRHTQSPPSEDVTYYAMWSLSHASQDVETNGRFKDSAFSYILTERLEWGGHAVVTGNTEVSNDLLWEDYEAQGFDSQDSLFLEHLRDQSQKQIIHLDLRHDYLVYRDRARDIKQTVDLQEPSLPSAWTKENRFVFVANKTSIWSRWYMPYPDRSEHEYYSDRLVRWVDGDETELFKDDLTVQSAPESFGEWIEDPWFTFIETRNLSGDSTWAVGRLLRQEDTETRAYLSGEADRQALPVDWRSELGGWAVDDNGGIMLSMVAAYNASERQVNYGEDRSDPAEPIADDVEAASNYFTGGDLVALNELTVPDGEHAAFFNCAFVGA